jgi:O-antigen/teichoic acid export membrane protein
LNDQAAEHDDIDAPRASDGAGPSTNGPPPPTAEPAPAPHGPVTRQRVVSSATWIALGFGYSQIVRLVSNVILAHYLSPHAFGLMALVITFQTGLVLFSDLGIRTSIVQNRRGDDRNFLNTAWTLQIIRGVILGVAACLLAYPAAYWRPNPEEDMLWLMPLFGGLLVVEGFVSTKLLSLHRHLAQGKVVLMDVITQMAGVSTTLIWALAIDRGVAALAVGPVITTFCRLFLSHLMLTGQKNTFGWERSALRELLHFGRWIYLSTVLSFLAGHVDKLVIGIVSIENLGVYNIAWQLSFSVVTFMAAVSSQLIFPLYSRLLHQGRDLRPILGRTHRAAGTLAAVFIAGLIAAGPTLIRCLYDQRYQAASWILPMLALGSWLQIAESNAAAILLAQGKPKQPALSNGVKVLCLCFTMPLGWQFDGLRGLIIGFIVGDLARYITTAAWIRLQHISIFGSDLAWTLFAVALGILGLKIGEFLLPDSTFPDNHPSRGWLLVRFCAEGATVVVIWGIVALILRQRGYFREARPESDVA